MRKLELPGVKPSDLMDGAVLKAGVQVVHPISQRSKQVKTEMEHSFHVTLYYTLKTIIINSSMVSGISKNIVVHLSNLIIFWHTNLFTISYLTLPGEGYYC